MAAPFCVLHVGERALAADELPAVPGWAPRGDIADRSTATDRLDGDQATEPDADCRDGPDLSRRAQVSCNIGERTAPRRQAVWIGGFARRITGPGPIEANRGKAHRGQVLPPLVAHAVGGNLVPAIRRAEHYADPGGARDRVDHGEGWRVPNPSGRADTWLRGEFAHRPYISDESMIRTSGPSPIAAPFNLWAESSSAFRSRFIVVARLRNASPASVSTWHSSRSSSV